MTELHVYFKIDCLRKTCGLCRFLLFPDPKFAFCKFWEEKLKVKRAEARRCPICLSHEVPRPLIEVDDRLKDFRERVRSAGIKPIKIQRQTAEDFGGPFPPGIIKKDAALHWDTWAEEAVELGLLDRSYTRNDFRNLFLGSTKRKIEFPF